MPKTQNQKKRNAQLRKKAYEDLARETLAKAPANDPLCLYLEKLVNNEDLKQRIKELKEKF